MDNATKHALKKQDQFISLSEHGISWASHNRQKAVVAGVIVVVAILAIVGGYAGYQARTAAAQVGFGEAMETYQTPLVTPGQPLPPGMKAYATAAERAKAADAQFSAVAQKYSLTNTGKLALYFSGLCQMEEGQNSSAEATLTKVAGSWDHDVAALGKLSLAQLYAQTGRDAQAADLYNELSKKGTVTVPSGMAQLQLADMYTAEGKTDKAKEIYAKLKDQDKDSKGQPGPAATVAEEKLNPKAAQSGE